MLRSTVLKKEKVILNEAEGKTDWKKWKAERNEEKKKRKEAKLIKQLDKRIKDEEQQKEQLVLEQQEKSNGRQYTVSIALPGSVMDNAQSPELRTYLAGQIARACAVFCVDEVVIFDEEGEDTKSVEGEFNGIGKKGKLVCSLLGYYSIWNVRSIYGNLFSRSTRTYSLLVRRLLNPLDSPHHMRVDEDAEFREGVILDRPSKAGKGSFVNCGMRKEVQIDKQLQAGLRVTVRLNKTQIAESKVHKGVVVAPHSPRTEGGLYWGYSVRLASCLSNVFTECPHKEGYDLTIGTSERGSNIDCVPLSPFKHMLVVFGGLQGLEVSVDTDQNLDVTDPSVLFDLYLNTCPNQGSRTIRTEEAILISLSGLRQKIVAAFMDRKS